MDSTEAQLRFGAALTHSSDPQHPNHPFHTPATSMNFFLTIFFSPMNLSFSLHFITFFRFFFNNSKKLIAVLSICYPSLLQKIYLITKWRFLFFGMYVAKKINLTYLDFRSFSVRLIPLIQYHNVNILSY